MNSKKQVSALLCLIVLLHASSALSVTPLFEKTDKYIETGTTTLDTNPYYGNTSSNTLQQVTFSATFAGSISSYNAVSSVQALTFDIDPTGVVNFTCFLCAYNVGGVDFCLLSKSLSQISALKKRYMILDSGFTKITHFYGAARYYVQNYGTNSYDSANPIVNNFGLPSINTVGTTRLFVLLNGFNGTSASNTSYSFDIAMSPQYIGSSTLRVTTASGNAVSIELNSLCYCIIGYNEDNALIWPFPAARITLGSFDLSTPFTGSAATLDSFNTFWGVDSLNTSSLTTINWDSTLTPLTQISATTSQTGSSYTLAGMSFEFKECNASITPYYMISEDKCYDICPDRYYEDNGYMVCVNCTNYDCLKCVSNGTCTTCDNTTDFRVLNASTGRC